MKGEEINLRALFSKKKEKKETKPLLY